MRICPVLITASKFLRYQVMMMLSSSRIERSYMHEEELVELMLHGKA